MSADSEWCVIYVDASVTDTQLARTIAELLGGSCENRCVSTRTLELDVESNDDFDAKARVVRPDGFLHFRYRIEMEYPDSMSSEVRDVVATLLTRLWAIGIPAVAACDFEEDLPHLGGGQLPIDSTPWPT